MGVENSIKLQWRDPRQEKKDQTRGKRERREGHKICSWIQEEI